MHIDAHKYNVTVIQVDPEASQLASPKRQRSNDSEFFEALEIWVPVEEADFLECF